MNSLDYALFKPIKRSEYEINDEKKKIKQQNDEFIKTHNLKKMEKHIFFDASVYYYNDKTRMMYSSQLGGQLKRVIDKNIYKQMLEANNLPFINFYV